MIDKTLLELKLPDRYQIVVAGVIKDKKLTRPMPKEKLQENDRLLLIGSGEDIEKMIEENK
jgi:Trk K+ transport system NAD-binding subunit